MNPEPNERERVYHPLNGALQNALSHVRSAVSRHTHSIQVRIMYTSALRSINTSTYPPRILHSLPTFPLLSPSSCSSLLLFLASAW